MWEEGGKDAGWHEIAAGNFVGDTTKAGGKSVGAEQKTQNQTGGQ